MKQFSTILHISYRLVKTYHLRGRCYLDKKDYEQALQDLSKAHEMDPNNKGISNEMTKAKKLKMENVKKGKKFK